MKTKKVLFYLFLLTFSFSASFCSKYEEGPTVSFIPKTQRIANTWSLDARFKNGTEESLSSSDMKTTLTFTEDGDAEGAYTDGGFTYKGTGTWEFSDDKEEITVVITYSGFGFSITDEKTYKILKLKSDELWLEYTEDDGDKMEYHFEPA